LCKIFRVTIMLHLWENNKQFFTFNIYRPIRLKFGTSDLRLMSLTKYDICKNRCSEKHNRKFGTVYNNLPSVVKIGTWNIYKCICRMCVNISTGKVQAYMAYKSKWISLCNFHIYYLHTVKFRAKNLNEMLLTAC
jgi:hypothetical protein